MVGNREGVKTVAINMEREISLKKDLISLLDLYRFFKKETPYIVHANTPKGSMLAMIAAKFAGVPNRIYTVTGLRFETEKGLLKFILKSCEILTCLCATKVIPEGDGVKNILIKEKITSKPLNKIHNGNINGVDLAYYNTNNIEIQEEIKELESDDFTFCFIGRLNYHKGINELINAFEKINNKYPYSRLLLIGPIEQPIDQNIINKIDNNDKILFYDYQEDVRPFLGASDIFVFPSYREGFPNVVLQAGAMNLPSIVTNISGCNEIIIEDYNGYIIEPKNQQDLFNAMEKAYLNKVNLNIMGNNAYNIINEKFNQKDVWDELIKMYLSLDKQ